MLLAHLGPVVHAVILVALALEDVPPQLPHIIVVGGLVEIEIARVAQICAHLDCAGAREDRGNCPVGFEDEARSQSVLIYNAMIAIKDEYDEDKRRKNRCKK